MRPRQHRREIEVLTYPSDDRRLRILGRQPGSSVRVHDHLRGQHTPTKVRLIRSQSERHLAGTHVDTDRQLVARIDEGQLYRRSAQDGRTLRASVADCVASGQRGRFDQLIFACTALSRVIFMRTRRSRAEAAR